MREALLAAAREEAARLSHGFVGTEHLLLALLRLQEPALVAALEAAGVTPAHAQSRLEKGRRGRRPPVRPGEDGQPGLTSHARRALDAANGEPAALVQAFLRDEGSLLARLLRPSGNEAPAVEAAPAPEAATPPRPSERREQAKPRKEREPRQKRERQPPVAEERSRARPTENERPRRGEPRRAPREPALDDEPPFVPRLAVQPRRHRRFPWVGLPLLFVPVAIWLEIAGAPAPTLLLVTAAGILALSVLLGMATEHLTARSGPVLGELLSAALGHVAVLVIAISALRAGLGSLVQAAIIGSVLAHMLLVPGLALLAGGAKPPMNKPARARTGGGGMLALAIAVLALPSLSQLAGPLTGDPARSVSFTAAVVLGVTLLCAFVHAGLTQRRLLGVESDRSPEETWGRPRAALLLLLALAGVIALSGILVHAIQQVSAAPGWSPFFLGLILLPLIGSGAAHSGAIRSARNGQANLAMGASAGVATQAVLALAPALVGAGLILGVPVVLLFTPFELTVVAVSALGVGLMARNGEADWFEGVQLLSVYLVIGIAAWFI